MDTTIYIIRDIYNSRWIVFNETDSESHISLKNALLTMSHAYSPDDTLPVNLEHQEIEIISTPDFSMLHRARNLHQLTNPTIHSNDDEAIYKHWSIISAIDYIAAQIDPSQRQHTWSQLQEITGDTVILPESHIASTLSTTDSQWYRRFCNTITHAWNSQIVADRNRPRD